MKIMLVLRVSYTALGAHIQSLLNQGFDIHLVTTLKAAWSDPRFAHCVDTTGMTEDEIVEVGVRHAREHGIPLAVTFWESDIVTTSRINEALGHRWANPEVERISRDKTRQRALAAAHGLPSVEFRVVPADGTIPQDLPHSESYIVKPVRLSASIGVQRVSSRAEITKAIDDIRAVTKNWMGNFYTGTEPEIALIEEYLPGREITVDGLVSNGRFYLGGVINKMTMEGPFFMEDYYTLPYRYPEEEQEIVAIVQAIVDALGTKHALMNVELRQDAAGNFRIVEFSTRISGGQNYMNLRMAHTIDLVRTYVKAALTDGRATFDGEPDRHPGKMAACIKFAYRGGTVIRNTAGGAAASPYFRDYIPTAQPGRTLLQPPEGWFEVAGSLSVVGPYRDLADIDGVERIADDLDRRLDLICIPVGAETQSGDSATDQGARRTAIGSAR
jgi:hypothetical protein